MSADLIASDRSCSPLPPLQDVPPSQSDSTPSHPLSATIAAVSQQEGALHLAAPSCGAPSLRSCRKAVRFAIPLKINTTPTPDRHEANFEITVSASDSGEDSSSLACNDNDLSLLKRTPSFPLIAMEPDVLSPLPPEEYAAFSASLSPSNRAIKARSPMSSLQSAINEVFPSQAITPAPTPLTHPSVIDTQLTQPQLRTTNRTSCMRVWHKYNCMGSRKSK